MKPYVIGHRLVAIRQIPVKVIEDDGPNYIAAVVKVGKVRRLAPF